MTTAAMIARHPIKLQVMRECGIAE